MVWAILAAVSLGIGMVFWRMGAPGVLPFAAAEVLILAVALVVYARHAADSESIWLDAGCLRVDQWVAGKVHRFEFQAAWVRIESAAGSFGPLRLVGQGCEVGVGRHLTHAARLGFERELRKALLAYR